MSDYGFKTLDKSNATVINAKYPIFGFDMAHLPRAYKTFHIQDNKTNPFVSGDVSVPSITPLAPTSFTTKDNYDYGSVRELIKKVKHGYGFRPVGYASISGTFSFSKSVSIEQDEVKVDETFVSFGGDYGPIESSHIISLGQHILPTYTGDMFVAEAGSANDNLASPSYTPTQADYTGTIFHTDITPLIALYLTRPVPNGLPSTFKTDFIEVEIDDEYIYIYRKYWWSDTIRRVIRSNNPITSPLLDDLRERIKIVNQTTGSAFDVTVYLCPYPIEELLNKASPHIDPSQVGIWDVDNWDGGKVYG